MPKRIVNPGDRFNRWVIIKETTPNKISGNRMVIAKCHCGKIESVRLADMVAGRSKSCGCLSLERCTTHGFSKTRLYVIWKSMIARCTNPKHDSYSNYGAKGISVCKQWKDVTVFISWSLTNGYGDSMTIDRIDSKGNYTPSNCRWVTVKDQQNNRKSNHFLTFKGKKLTLAQWGELVGINRRTILNRLRIGWSVPRALTTPVNIKRKRKVE